MTAIKFCGVTRPEDAREAGALGAAYVGVILASGPRLLTPDRAARVLAHVPESVARVGVFAAQPAGAIVEIAIALGLNVVQLHADPDPAVIRQIRDGFGGAVWAVARFNHGLAPAGLREAFEAADAVVVDAFAPGRLGGTGVALPWQTMAPALESMRAGRRVVLAGGLRPENVGAAIAAIAPDVVDVSSGVESAPGIKDHARMRAFRDAVRAALVEQ